MDPRDELPTEEWGGLAAAFVRFRAIRDDASHAVESLEALMERVKQEQDRKNARAVVRTMQTARQVVEEFTKRIQVKAKEL